jgi:hypothetical protein
MTMIDRWDPAVVFFAILGSAVAGAILYVILAWVFEKRRTKRDPGVWRKRPELELYVIACRSVGVEPTPVIDRDPHNAQLRHLAQAIQRGELRANVPANRFPRTNDKAFFVRTKREDLLDFATRTNDQDLVDWINNEWVVKRR